MHRTGVQRVTPVHMSTFQVAWRQNQRHQHEQVMVAALRTAATSDPNSAQVHRRQAASVLIEAGRADEAESFAREAEARDR